MSVADEEARIPTMRLSTARETKEIPKIQTRSPAKVLLRWRCQLASVLQSVTGSIKLKMQPIPQFDEDLKGKNAGQADMEEDGEDDDDASIASSAASLATEASTKPGGQKSRASSRALSQRSEGRKSVSRNSATSSKMGPCVRPPSYR
eukprot:767911-Hanusia_phi.AAC.1